MKDALTEPPAIWRRSRHRQNASTTCRENNIMAARRLYLPPFAVLLNMLGLGRVPAAAPADDEKVLVPFGVLRLLVRGALAAMPFDEERYLRLNPDVASAVFRGAVSSGEEHFIADGYFEGRDGGGEEFAEAWYLSVNEDVAAAVGGGSFPTGQSHYAEVGMFELRGPNPRAEEDMALWRACTQPKPRAISAADNPPIALDAARRKSAK